MVGRITRMSERTCESTVAESNVRIVRHPSVLSGHTHKTCQTSIACTGIVVGRRCDILQQAIAPGETNYSCAVFAVGGHRTRKIEVLDGEIIIDSFIA